MSETNAQGPVPEPHRAPAPLRYGIVGSGFITRFHLRACMEQIAAGVDDGAELRGLICEKPLGRNLAEARHVAALARRTGVPTAYFENQVHMPSVATARLQLAGVAESMGPVALARSRCRCRLTWAC